MKLLEEIDKLIDVKLEELGRYEEIERNIKDVYWNNPDIANYIRFRAKIRKAFSKEQPIIRNEVRGKDQLEKEYIENYLTFANKLTQKAIESADKGLVTALSEEALKAAQTAIPMLEILALENNLTTVRRKGDDQVE